MKEKLIIKQAKIWKTGDSYVITIPSDFIKHGLLKEGQSYQFEVKEGQNEE